MSRSYFDGIEMAIRILIEEESTEHENNTERLKQIRHRLDQSLESKVYDKTASAIKQRIDLIWSECFDSELKFTKEQLNFIESQIADIKQLIDAKW